MLYLKIYAKHMLNLHLWLEVKLSILCVNSEDNDEQSQQKNKPSTDIKQG